MTTERRDVPEHFAAIGWQLINNLKPTDNPKPEENPMTHTTQPLDLEPIRQRADAATTGPWAAGGGKWLHPWELTLSDTYPLIELDCTPQGTADAAFIAAGRTDVPALVAEVERLRAEADQWRDSYECAHADRLQRSLERDRTIDEREYLKAEVERLRAALTLIGVRCANYTAGDCIEDGARTPDAPYTADRWCDQCIARHALIHGWCEWCEQPVLAGQRFDYQPGTGGLLEHTACAAPAAAADTNAAEVTA